MPYNDGLTHARVSCYVADLVCSIIFVHGCEMSVRMSVCVCVCVRVYSRACVFTCVLTCVCHSTLSHEDFSNTDQNDKS